MVPPHTAELSPAWQPPCWQRTRVATIGSTQDALRARIRDGSVSAATVLQAGEQHRGRGQRAPDWHSPVGGAYQSFALCDPRCYQSYLPLAIALGIAEQFQTCGLQIRIKWSNDLLYKDKKLAGILCEKLGDWLLIGVGMNVNNPVPQGAIGLRGWQLESVYQHIIAGVNEGLGYCANQYNITARFAAFDALRDQRVCLEQGGHSYQGIARGIDAQGCLQLETEQGRRSICWTDPERGRLRRLPDAASA